MTDRCRSCDAEIIWARTVNGKLQPFDAKPTKGTILSAVAPEDAPELAGMEGPFAKVVDIWTPHHSTCPQGRSWRRDRPRIIVKESVDA
jgi:hypothetical protein